MVSYNTKNLPNIDDYMKNLVVFIGLFYAIFGFSQTDSIGIKMVYQENSPILQVNETFDVQANSLDNYFYLHTWANAYKDRNSVLSQVKVRERRDALHFAKLKDRGWIENLQILDSIGNPIEFEEVNNELIRLKMPNKQNRYQFTANYSIHLPNTLFTGYGMDEEGNLLLKYFFLQPALRLYDGIFEQHFKDFEALTTHYNHYTLNIKVPEQYQVFTDLEKIDKENYQGGKMGFFQISVQNAENTKTITTDKGTVIFGLKIEDSDILLAPIIRKELNFLNAHLGGIEAPVFISKKNYNKNKFQGVQDIKVPVLPKFKLFKDDERIQLEMISQLSAAYVQRKILVDQINDHWIPNGIEAYLQLKYIEQNVPNLRLSGEVPDKIQLFGAKPLNIFAASKVKMTERAQYYYRTMLLSNLDQSIETPFDELSNPNQTVVSSIKTALAFQYLAAYMGGNEFDEILRKLIQEFEGRTINRNQFAQFFMANSTKDIKWFFDELLVNDKNIDFGIKSIDEKSDSLEIKIKNKTQIKTPFRISAYKNDEKVYDDWFMGDEKKQKITIPNADYDVLVLNDSVGMPDFNMGNNYLKPGSLLRRKIKIGLVTDIPRYDYEQIFLFPEFSWNNYDKLQMGITMSNKTVLPQKWTYTIRPQYSIGESSFTGSVRGDYYIYPDEGWFRQIRLTGGYNYQHYNKGLAYSNYQAGGVFTFERNARSLKNKSIFATFQQIKREMPLDANPIDIELKDYNLANVGLFYWNPGILSDLRTLLNVQHSNKFSKFFGEVYWRWKFAENKRLGVRLFAGAFLRHELKESGFFDFGLDRVTDYMFMYDLLGRSEVSGPLSQQFVMAEGGFKSNFFARANQYMVTSNFEYPLWKFLDVYADVGVYKNKHLAAKFVYDSGFRIRIVPDFLELYFPIQSTLGFEPTLGAYHTRIRYLLSLDINKLLILRKRSNNDR